VIGARIRGWREKRGVPIGIFADLCGLPCPLIREIEAGTVGPTPASLRAICAALRIDEITLREGPIAVRKGGCDEPDDY
jgi:transcriptional regulator with XRE-family HTH domain